jgi:hypothetical protein
MRFFEQQGAHRYKLASDRYSVSWKGLDFGRIALRANGRWQWLSMRGIRGAWADTLDDATDALVAAELEA